MFCQQLSRSITKDARGTLVEAMVGWLNECEGVTHWTCKVQGWRHSPSGRADEERGLRQKKLQEQAGGH